MHRARSIAIEGIEGVAAPRTWCCSWGRPNILLSHKKPLVGVITKERRSISLSFILYLLFESILCLAQNTALTTTKTAYVIPALQILHGDQGAFAQCTIRLASHGVFFTCILVCKICILCTKICIKNGKKKFPFVLSGNMCNGNCVTYFYQSRFQICVA